jgi:hypothetical protein
LEELWFAGITNKKIKREGRVSVKELVKAVENYIKNRNRDGKPFKWTKSVQVIIYVIHKAKTAYSN